MSLEVGRLENVRELAGGILQARCPACAEGGNDRTGNHLRVYPDGRFGCCVHPKDRQHRKQIFALAGCKSDLASPGTFTLRIKTPPALPAAESVKTALTATRPGTLGTGRTELEEGVPAVPRLSASSVEPNSGTLGTGHSELRARTGELIPNVLEICHEQLKDWESAVPSVPRPVLPYLTAGGDLVIPFDSPERYHWWKGGQTASATREECGLTIADCGMEEDKCGFERKQREDAITI